MYISMLLDFSSESLRSYTVSPSQVQIDLPLSDLFFFFVCQNCQSSVLQMRFSSDDLSEN